MTTPRQINERHFGDAKGLTKPLNDVLHDIQLRLTALEDRKELVVLGTREFRLPVDSTTPPLEFQLPDDFTPLVVFPLELRPARSGVLDVLAQPASYSIDISGNIVQVRSIQTSSPTGGAWTLTLGAIRG